jgi:hypothetical protein
VSVVSQRFSCVPDVGGRAACENNDVSLAVKICARGLPSQLDLRPSKLLTCSDTTRPGRNEGVRDLLQLHEFSHHVQTPAVTPTGLRRPESGTGTVCLRRCEGEFSTVA